MNKVEQVVAILESLSNDELQAVCWNLVKSNEELANTAQVCIWAAMFEQALPEEM